MKTALNKIHQELQQADDWVTTEELWAVLNTMKHAPPWRDIKRKLDNTANIGSLYDRERQTTVFRWYEPNELTNKVQECLDRGDDW